MDPNWHHSMIVGFSGLMQPNHWGTVQLGPPKMLLFLIGIHLPKKDRFMLVLNGCTPARDWLTWGVLPAATSKALPRRLPYTLSWEKKGVDGLLGISIVPGSHRVTMSSLKGAHPKGQDVQPPGRCESRCERRHPSKGKVIAMTIST